VNAPMFAAVADPRAFDPRMLVWPALLGLGIHLLVTSLRVGQPRPDLGEQLRRLDVDERIRQSELGRRNERPLFASRLLEGMLRPVLEDAGRAARELLARVGLAGGAMLERRLRVMRPGVEPVQFVGEKLTAGLVLGAVFPLMDALGIRPFGSWPVWVWLIGFAVGFAAPDWDLERRDRARRSVVLMELPTVLDLLTLATSAGMGLEHALEEVGRRSEGVIARELRMVSRELALGQRRNLREALEAMAERVDVPEMDRVVGRLSATYEQGLPLGSALAAQAQALREQQRMHILEEGGKATVRMLLPVAVLILPVLFVVVLVPAAIELTRLGG
jgi:tight adherence protein C